MKKNASAKETAPDILIVDDNPNNLRMLCDMLMEQYWKVRPVSDGMLALQAATTNPPDLIPVSYTHLTLPTNREV